MKSFLNKYQYQLLLFLFIFILFFVNYSLNTYLSGWDNLQTELNPQLAVKRAFFSVWQEYQSFGLLAGMAHAADLVRAIFLWAISFVLPQNTIRYFYHFLMLFLGGLGMMKLLSKDFSVKEKGEKTKFLAFLGGIFYMINFGTVQIFYLPFESFSTFFAFLPWSILIFLKLLYPYKNINRNDLILFFLINFFGTPAFYTQQLFVVYFAILLTISLGKIITIKNPIFNYKDQFKKVFFAFLLILIINSFWILPQVYFLKTSSYVVYEAKINQLATDDVYYQNKEKGTFPYFLRLEGFYFDLFDKNNQYLFLPWKNHFERFYFFQYLFAFLFILGIFSVLKKKDYRFIFPLTLVIVAFLNATWPINVLDNFIRENKFLNQIFRSPFTKFIIPYSLLYSYFVIQGIKLVIDLKNKALKQDIKHYFSSIFLYFLIPLSIVIYAFPVFKGFFITKEMKIKIPDDYFQLFSYFKSEDKNKRIALLPEYTFWGWFQHKWGYNGSGFLWYGIEQPIVSRTFDVWNEKSESYFWEIKEAINKENKNQFKNILDKYQIDYLLVDYSLKPIVGTIKGLQYDKINNLLNDNQQIKPLLKTKNFTLYKIEKEEKQKDFITFYSNLNSTFPKSKIIDKDNLYPQYKNYFYEQKNPQIISPFYNLTSVKRIADKNWQIKENKDNFQIVFSSEDINLSQYKLIDFKEKYQAIINNGEKISDFSLTLLPQINNNSLTISFDKKLINEINNDKLIKNQCFKKTNCYSFILTDLPQRYSYLIKIKNKNISGRRLFFYILDNTEKQTYLEERLKNDLEYFIIPSGYQYGVGYNVVSHENQYENFLSKNKIEDIEIYLFPYDNLKFLKLISSDFKYEKQISIEDFFAKKNNYFSYQVSLDNEKIKQFDNSLFLILSQSFHPGWKAFLNGKELKEHVLVNNWANGWKIDEKICSLKNEECKITILFWPQYLEFVGFGLLIIGFLFILFYRPIS